jgi:hypothetical protein
VRLRREIEHASQITLGKRRVAQPALSLNERRVFLRIQMRSPFHRLLGADESRDDELLDAPMATLSYQSHNKIFLTFVWADLAKKLSVLALSSEFPQRLGSSHDSCV